MQTLKEKEEEVYSRDDSYYLSDGYVSNFMQGVEFAQKWISVKDELPCESGIFLVKFQMPASYLFEAKVNEIYISFFKNGAWTIEAQGGGLTVTDWRPITVS